MRVKSGEAVATVPFDRIGPGFQRAEVRFEGLQPPLRSFSVRIFAGAPEADAATPTSGNPHYLGTQHFYGLGAPDVLPDPNDPYRLGRASQSARTEVRLNVTEGVRAFLRACAPQTAPISLVAVDRDGRPIEEPDLDLEGITLFTR